MKQQRFVKFKWSCVALWMFTATVTHATVAHAADPRNELPKKQHRTSDAPFLTPEQAVKKMAIPEGFDVSIYASEPDIAEPIAFCFDDRGRMWVAENFNYRTRRDHTDDPVSRIQILEDTNSDGVFDKKKTFTDTLTFTSGIAPGFGGVFVGSPPNLTFIPDADGDDVPDGPPQILLDGWGINDRHETLNSFMWGPDGWLYGCHGVFTQSRVGKPGDNDEARQFIDGGIWRYHPTQKKFEVYARGLSNPWGFDFNDQGQGFVTCCVIPHLYHIVQGGVYTKQSRPHVNPHIYDDIKTIRTHKNRLSAHGGARVYLADAFPSEYRNRLFMCNIHEHAVLTDILTPKGSSFIGSHGDDFMPTNDLAWVGFSVETGPEGGVYVLDWHDTDVCGNTINFANSGRIYRITPKGAKPIERPNLRAMTDAQLVDLQSHSNDWYVRQARLLLHSRTAAGELDSELVHKKLNQLFNDPRTTGPKRLRALWALHVTDGLNTDRLRALLDHDDEYVRGWSIQFLCDQSSIHSFQTAATTKEPVISRETHGKFVEMASQDNSPIVRLYLASALGRLPFSDRWAILEGLVSHAEDVDDNNLPRMYWFALEPMVPKHTDKALTLAVSGKIPKLQEFVARRMLSGETVVDLSSPKKPKPKPEWQTTIQKVAPGFNVRNVGEGGVVEHKAFRNSKAVQTHPLNKNRASSLHRTATIPEDKKTTLQMRVSHHPHGDWQLRVLADGKMIENQLVSSKSVGDDEWMEVSVDLTPYAGKKIRLSIENHPNNWMNEWAYWNKVVIISE
ncbi:MAG: PVC-type heme-binding CxxCH protein [Rubripirellula sp.]